MKNSTSFVATSRCDVQRSTGPWLHKFLIHDVNINIPARRVPERARQCADNFHPEILPKLYRRFVGRDDEIELHRAEAEPARFLQTMFAQRATDPPPARTFRDNERGIGDVRATRGLIRAQRVRADNSLVVFGKTNMRVVFEPVVERTFPRDVEFDRIRLAGRDHFPKNFPDRIAIRILYRPDLGRHNLRGCDRVKSP
jgi:hypothetical protein